MRRTPQGATTAYYRRVPAVGALRLAFAFLQRLWPALAVRAASGLFLMPLPPKWLARGKRWGGRWQASEWPFEGASLTVYAHDGDGALVLLAHGWGGHAGQMKALAHALAAAGMRPLIIDMPGHGRSAGTRSSLPQFARAIDYAVARLAAGGTPVTALVAHSLGATAAAFAAARNLPLERLVLVAPAASPVGYTRMFAQVFGLDERLRRAMQERIEAREGALMHNFEPAMLGARVRMPTLVVHDRRDTVNPFGDGQAYAFAVRGAQLMATEGLGHRALLEDAAVVAQVVAFAAAGQRPRVENTPPDPELRRTAEV